jgi:hypothetical protein
MMLSPALKRRAQVVGEHAREWVYRVSSRPLSLTHERPQFALGQIESAIDQGIRFLEGRLERDGALRDFLLPPGTSTTWLTAHVAFVLEDVPGAASINREAARHLSSVGLSDGGWGYNRLVAPDVDSTAQAIMVLLRQGVRPPGYLVEWFTSAQTPDGGFPTYPPATPGKALRGWETAHPDVTLIALEALRRLGTLQSRIDAAVAWLEQNAHGADLAYWWPFPAYVLWARRRCGPPGSETTLAARGELARTASLPEAAMLLAAATTADDAADACRPAVVSLLAQQLRDGSWPCAPCLRVTEPWVFRGGADQPGQLYAGHRRVFSTAHAVAALHRVASNLR